MIFFGEARSMMLQSEIPNVSRDFLRACHSGDIHKVKTLVEKHGISDWSDFRYVTSGDTALHVAAREGNINIVRYLCEEFNMLALKVDVTNKDMKRPLHEAAQFAQEDILKYLLRKGIILLYFLFFNQLFAMINKLQFAFNYI